MNQNILKFISTNYMIYCKSRTCFYIQIYFNLFTIFFLTLQKNLGYHFFYFKISIIITLKWKKRRFKKIHQKIILEENLKNFQNVYYIKNSIVRLYSKEFGRQKKENIIFSNHSYDNRLKTSNLKKLLRSTQEYFRLNFDRKIRSLCIYFSFLSWTSRFRKFGFFVTESTCEKIYDFNLQKLFKHCDKKFLFILKMYRNLLRIVYMIRKKLVF